ncbi:GldG family protein [bacterium]|nr:GldG family protein [bacterium]
MKQSRKTSEGILSIYLFLFGLVIILSAGITVIMAPSKTQLAWGILAVGCFLVVLGFARAPLLLREVLLSRRSKLIVNDVVLILSIVGIGVLLSYIAFRRHIRYDFTKDRLFSISESTIHLLSGLKKDVKITAFFAKGGIEGRMVEDLLKEYKHRAPERISFELVDPLRDPIRTKGMNVTTMGTVIVQCENNRKDIDPNDIFIVNQNPYQRQMEQPKFQGEQALSSAILNVTQGSKRKIFFVSGHNEPSINAYKSDGWAGVKQFLEKENYEVSEDSLVKPLPLDIKVVAVISPKKSFHPSEIANLKSFVKDSKGALFVALDPDSKCPELESFLTEVYGVNPNNEIIINPRSIGNDPAIIVPQYGYHSIVKAQSEKKSGVLMQVCRGLSFEKREGWHPITVMLKSNDESYAKRNMADVLRGNIEFSPETDVRGPLNLGLAVEGEAQASASRAVFFGDSDFASNMLLQVQGNSDLIINTFNWLAGQEQLISIRPKTIEIGHIVLDKESITRIFVLTVVVSPLIVVFLGGLVWFARRRV